MPNAVLEPKAGAALAAGALNKLYVSGAVLPKGFAALEKEKVLLAGVVLDENDDALAPNAGSDRGAVEATAVLWCSTSPCSMSILELGESVPWLPIDSVLAGTGNCAGALKGAKAMGALAEEKTTDGVGAAADTGAGAAGVTEEENVNAGVDDVVPAVLDAAPKVKAGALLAEPVLLTSAPPLETLGTLEPNENPVAAGASADLGADARPPSFALPSTEPKEKVEEKDDEVVGARPKVTAPNEGFASTVLEPSFDPSNTISALPGSAFDDADDAPPKIKPPAVEAVALFPCANPPNKGALAGDALSLELSANLPPKTKPPDEEGPPPSEGAEKPVNTADGGAESSLLGAAPKTKPTLGAAEELLVGGLAVVVVAGAAAHEGTEVGAAEAHEGTAGAAAGAFEWAGPAMSLSHDTHFFALLSLGTMQAGHFTVSALAALAQIESPARAAVTAGAVTAPTPFFVSTDDVKDVDAAIFATGLAPDEEIKIGFDATAGVDAEALAVFKLDDAALGVASIDTFFLKFGGENTYFISL